MHDAYSVKICGLLKDAPHGCENEPWRGKSKYLTLKYAHFIQNKAKNGIL